MSQIRILFNNRETCGLALEAVDTRGAPGQGVDTIIKLDLINELLRVRQ